MEAVRMEKKKANQKKSDYYILIAIYPFPSPGGKELIE